MEKILTTNATPDNALLSARSGAAGRCRYDNDVPDIDIQDESVKHLLREIGLGREFRLNDTPKMIYCALYHVINDYDTYFEKDNVMHWCLLIALLISTNCTENTEDKAKLKFYFDLFHHWFPHEFEECNTFKNGGMQAMTKQLRNGGKDEKIMEYKNLHPAEWTSDVFRDIKYFKNVTTRFEEYLKEYKQKELNNLIPMR